MLQQRVSEVRTQIYLPQNLHRQLQAVAERRGLSVAAVIRDSVSKTLGLKNEIKSQASQKQKERAWQKLMKLSGFIKGGPRDISQRTGEHFAQASWERIKKGRQP